MSNASGVESHSNQLRANTLGVGAITFQVVSAAAPLTAVAGGVPLSILLGNGPGIPAAFLLVTVLLLVFSVGYVEMSRHVSNAGAFYAYTARGLGGMAGSAAAFVALLSYNAIGIGVIGLVGATAARVIGNYGLQLPWWVWSCVITLAVGLLGYRRVDLSAYVLTVIVFFEFVVLLILDLAIIGVGGDAGLSVAPFSPALFMQGVPAIGVLFCFAAFIGFEATTIYSEEARNPRVTIPRATYISVILIGSFYMFSSWCMVIGTGISKLVPQLQSMQDPTFFLFTLSDRYVGVWLSRLMEALFITSLFACVLAFHNGVARYMYVAAREKLLPPAIGKTHSRSQSPHMASLTQTALSLIVLTVFAAGGLDPVLAMFSWLTNMGTLGVIVLMAVTSVSVVAFFSRNPTTRSNWLGTIAMPVAATLALVTVAILIVANFGALSGARGFVGWFLPALILVSAVVGLVVARRLRRTNVEGYARLGKPVIIQEGPHGS